MRSNPTLVIAISLTVCGFALADSLEPSSTQPLNGRPWVESWTGDASTLAEEVAKAGRIAPAQEAALAAHLAANKDALDRAVLMGRAERLPRLAATPNFRLIRSVGHSLVARGLMLEARDPDAAIAQWLAAVRLAQSVAKGARENGVLIDAMVGIAIQRYPVEALLARARSGKLTGAQARTVLATLARRDAEGMPTIPQIVENESRIAEKCLREMTAAQAQSDLKEIVKLHPEIEMPQLLAEFKRLAPRVGARLRAESAAFVATGKTPVVNSVQKRLEDQLVSIALPNYPAAIKRLQEREAQVAALKTACRKIAG